MQTHRMPQKPSKWGPECPARTVPPRLPQKLDVIIVGLRVLRLFLVSRSLEGSERSLGSLRLMNLASFGV